MEMTNTQIHVLLRLLDMLSTNHMEDDALRLAVLICRARAEQDIKREYRYAGDDEASARA